MKQSTPTPNHGRGEPGLSVVRIYDTTLRDGTQREGLSLSAADKIRIARLLDGLGVGFIELGWPGSNPKDAEAFERARDIEWGAAALAAFGSTRRAGCSPDADPQVGALLATGAPVCTIFGKSSLLHVREVLRIASEENLRMIAETVGYLVENGRRVVYDAEHFFDGYREDPEFAMETLWAAARAGRRGDRPLRHQRRDAPVGDRAARRRGRARAGQADRHPRARRRGVRRRQLDRRGARRRDARAGDAQRIRRALRQREPLFDRAEPRAQDGQAVPSRRRARGAHARGLAGRRDREPGARRARGVRRAERVRAQGRGARRGDSQAPARLRARRSRRSSGTGRASSSASSRGAATCSRRPRSSR